MRVDNAGGRPDGKALDAKPAEARRRHRFDWQRPLSDPFDFESLLSAEGRGRVAGSAMVTPRTVPSEVRADLTVGQPAEEALPLAEMVEAARRALPGNPPALLYGRGSGTLELVDVVREKLLRYEGLAVARDQIVITNGSSQAVDLTLRAFADPGSVIGLDEASFGAMMARRITDRGVHVGFDAEGPCLGELERHASAAERMRVFYTIPTFQNPMGVTTSVQRRREILDLCRRLRVPILEDDAYYELRYEGERVPSLFELEGGSGLVVRAGTFSKILGAGIRLGWLLTSAPLAERIVRLRADGGSSPYSSSHAAEFMRRHMGPQISRLRAIYRSRRDLMLEQLERHLAPWGSWEKPAGGFFIWVRLHDTSTVDAVVQRCRDAGVLVRNAREFRVDGKQLGAVRLAFSNAPVDQIRVGVATLGRVAAEVAAAPSA